MTFNEIYEASSPRKPELQKGCFYVIDEMVMDERELNNELNDDIDRFEGRLSSEYEVFEDSFRVRTYTPGNPKCSHWELFKTEEEALAYLKRTLLGDDYVKDEPISVSGLEYMPGSTKQAISRQVARVLEGIQVATPEESNILENPTVRMEIVLKHLAEENELYWLHKELSKLIKRSVCSAAIRDAFFCVADKLREIEECDNIPKHMIRKDSVPGIVNDWFNPDKPKEIDAKASLLQENKELRRLLDRLFNPACAVASYLRHGQIDWAVKKAVKLDERICEIEEWKNKN